MQGEDVVVMAQALEKMFKSKLAQMPKEEIKIETSPGKVIKKKPKPPVGTFVGGVNKVTTKPISNVEQSFVQLQLPSETSTNTSTTKPISLSTPPDVQQNLHTLINQPPAPATSTLQIPTSSAPYLINQPTINSVPVLSQQQPAKVKKGVKRKADTTTPTTAIGFNESIDAKVSTRGRQVNN